MRTPKQPAARDLSKRQIRPAKYAADPLVSFDRARFRAAFAESSYSAKRGGKARFAAEVSKEAGRNSIKRQAVDGWLKGSEAARCRDSVFRAVSLLLDLPDGWLAGDGVTVPFTAGLRLGLPVEGLPDYPVVAAQMKQRLLLAKVKLVAACAKACRDDFRLLRYPESESENGAHIEDAAVMFLASAVLDITATRRWRSTLLQSRVVERRLTEAERAAPPGGAGLIAPIPALTDDEERLDLAYTRALTRVLTPWLSGEECLDYAGLRRAFVGLNPGAAMRTNLCAQPSEVRRSNGSLVHIADRFTPLALFGWNNVDQGGPLVGDSERQSVADRPARARG